MEKRERAVNPDQQTKRNGMKIGKGLLEKRNQKRKGKMSQVKIVRLTSGEEIIAKVEKTETHVKMKKPAIIIPAGKEQIGLMGWLPYTKAEDGIEIQLTSVLFIVEPMEEMIQQYEQSFGSGLVVPNSTISTPSLKFTGNSE